MTRQNSIKDEIVVLEKSYWDAIKRKDGETTARLSGKLSLVTGANGVMSIAKDKMGSMTEDGSWELKSYEIFDVSVVTPSPDVAIIVYKVTQKVRMDGKEREFTAADSSTWIRGNDGWECHAHSETIMGDQLAA